MMYLKSVITIACLTALLSSCSSVRPNFLPQPDNFHQFPKGHHFEGDYSYGNNRQDIFGEMICMTDSSLILLSKEYGLNEFDKSEIRDGYIALSLVTNGTEIKKLKTLRTIDFISTITHGWWMALTIPINIAIISSQNKESAEGTYRLSIHNNKWEDLEKFCRFPQGLPDKVKREDLYYIEMIPAEMEY